MENDRLLCLAQVGQMLGEVSVKTVRRMIAAGVLPPPLYPGRSPMLCLSDVLSFIEKLKQKRNARTNL
jgi:predicted DNA-binding transcriptional regulator AlpA